MTIAIDGMTDFEIAHVRDLALTRCPPSKRIRIGLVPGGLAAWADQSAPAERGSDGAWLWGGRLWKCDAL